MVATKFVSLIGELMAKMQKVCHHTMASFMVFPELVQVSPDEFILAPPQPTAEAAPPTAEAAEPEIEHEACPAVELVHECTLQELLAKLHVVLIMNTVTETSSLFQDFRSRQQGIFHRCLCLFTHRLCVKQSKTKQSKEEQNEIQEIE